MLAQQIVAHAAARGETPVADVAALVRRCANFAELTDELLGNTLDLLAGRYPSEEFTELRPRLVWDRVTDTVRARDGSKRLAVTGGGTIPDRGLFGVFLPDGTRVGELDEEMVYESRPGETFLLGASTWRIEDITFERVIVTPAPGEPGKMPFWHGDRPGRPLELGRALGAFVRELRDLPTRRGATSGCATDYALDPLAASNLLQYLDEQAEATGAVPDDRTIVVERFRDEIGDWRVCILSPFGTPVHAPWAMAIERRLVERYDMPVETMWSDDGIVLRLPEAADELPLDELLIDPDDIDELVVADAAADVAVLGPVPRVRRRGRCCCRAAGPTSARRCGSSASGPPTCSRSPPSTRRSRSCSRRRASACRTCSTCRRCARCSASCAAAPSAWSASTPPRRARSRRACCSTGSPPTCTRATRRWPSAGPRRWRSTATCCASCSAPRSCASCSIPACSPTSSSSCSASPTAAGPAAPTSCTTCCARSATSPPPRSTCAAKAPVAESARPAVHERWLRLAERRAIEVGVAGEPRFVAAEDAARYRDALGCALPLGLPPAFTEPVARPLEELVGRYARTHGPFVDRDVGRRFGVPVERVARRARRARSRRAASCTASSGPAACGASGATSTCCASCAAARWPRCAARSSRSSRRRSPASCPAWHGIPAAAPRASTRWSRRSACCRGAARRLDARARRAAARVARLPAAPSSTSCARPARWCGSAPARSAPTDGRVRLYFADQLALLAPGSSVPEPPEGALHDALRAALGRARRQLLGPAPRRRRPATPTPSCSPRCGISCGRARSPTTRSRRCARDRRRRRADAGPAPAPAARPAPPGPAHPHRAARRCRPLEPGRAAARAGAVADRGGARHGAAAARAPRRRHPGGGAGRRRRRRVRRACTAC